MAESSERRVRGATIEEALNQARADFGTSDVRVLHATRLRRGGVGGFFAKDLGVELIVAPAHDADTLERQLAAGREVSAGVDLYRQLGREAADAAIAERAALLLAEDDRAHEAATQPPVSQPPVSQPVTRVPRPVPAPVAEVEADRPVWATALAPLIDEPAPRTSVAAALSKLSSAAGLTTPAPAAPQPPSSTLEVSPSATALAAMLDEGQAPEDDTDESASIAALVESITRRPAAPRFAEPAGVMAEPADEPADEPTDEPADEDEMRDVGPELAVTEDVITEDVVTEDVVIEDAVQTHTPEVEPVLGDVSDHAPHAHTATPDTTGEPSPTRSADDATQGMRIAGERSCEELAHGERAHEENHSTAGELVLRFDPSSPAEEQDAVPAPAAEAVSIPVLDATEPPVALDVLAPADSHELEAASSGEEQPITPASVSVTSQPAPSHEGFVADWGSWAVSRTLKAIVEERRRAIADEPAPVPALDAADAACDEREPDEGHVLDDTPRDAIPRDDIPRDDTASSGTVPRMENTGASSAPSREAVALWHASRALKQRQTEIVEAPAVTAPSTQYFANLRAAGLPDELLELIGEGASVREALASIDPAAAFPGALDGIVVIAGPAQLVTTWAQALAKASGLDPREVMTVSPVTTRENNRLSGAEEAFAWRCSRHGGTRLVALEVPTLGSMTGYVRSVIKALRPTQVRLLTRADDLDAAKRWLDVTPTAVLDVVGVSRSRRPAEFLALGAPVATIDGEAMDAGDLAATLLEHCCR